MYEFMFKPLNHFFNTKYITPVSDFCSCIWERVRFVFWCTRYFYKLQRRASTPQLYPVVVVVVVVVQLQFLPFYTVHSRTDTFFREESRLFGAGASVS